MTADPTGATLDTPAAIALVRQEGLAFAALLSPDAFAVPVTSCPGWSVADLARHLGGVHRWARHALVSGPAEDPPGPQDVALLPAWFHQGLVGLVQTLESRDEDEPCWTFADPPTVRFWARRQAHETTLHRWDAATSLGLSGSIPEPVAVDGIDEVTSMFVPRQVRLNRLAASPETVALVCASGPRFTVSTMPSAVAGDAGPRPEATVTGPAEALLLLLWRRIPLTDRRLEVTGSFPVAREFLSRPLTP